MTYSRRRFIVSAAPVGLAGCLGGSDRTANAGANAVDTYDVGGSPGGPLPVLPEGRVALLDYWATWCAPCKPQMAELRDIRERFPDVHLLSITNETDAAAIRDFWTEFEGTWAVASDPDLETNDQFEVNRIPTLLVFDADASEVWRHVGLAAVDSIAEALTDAGA
jgi:thiol-disulfide isomerase/thioredoxin